MLVTQDSRGDHLRIKNWRLSNRLDSLTSGTVGIAGMVTWPLDDLFLPDSRNCLRSLTFLFGRNYTAKVPQTTRFSPFRRDTRFQRDSATALQRRA